VGTWTPATGIKQPVLSTFTNRMCRDGWECAARSFHERGYQPRPSGEPHRTLMLKGSRVPQITAQKAADGGAKVRGSFTKGNRQFAGGGRWKLAVSSSFGCTAPRGKGERNPKDGWSTVQRRETASGVKAFLCGVTVGRNLVISHRKVGRVSSSVAERPKGRGTGGRTRRHMKNKTSQSCVTRCLSRKG
jgi:hypothetical protein